MPSSDSNITCDANRIDAGLYTTACVITVKTGSNTDELLMAHINDFVVQIIEGPGSLTAQTTDTSTLANHFTYIYTSPTDYQGYERQVVIKATLAANSQSITGGSYVNLTIPAINATTASNCSCDASSLAAGGTQMNCYIDVRYNATHSTSALATAFTTQLLDSSSMGSLSSSLLPTVGYSTQFNFTYRSPTDYVGIDRMASIYCKLDSLDIQSSPLNVTIPAGMPPSIYLSLCLAVLCSLCFRCLP